MSLRRSTNGANSERYDSNRSGPNNESAEPQMSGVYDLDGRLIPQDEFVAGNGNISAGKTLSESATALFVDGFEGYFDQHKLREKISNTPFSKAGEITHAEFARLINNQPGDLVEIQTQAAERFRQAFVQWALESSQGFSLCFYGIGSKRQVISQFIDYLDPEEAVVVANGYNTALTFKDILNTCVEAVVDETISGRWQKVPSERLLSFVAYLEESGLRLCLVVHSIDGPALQKEQGLLVRLASSRQVTLICSVDNLMAPLIWDQFQFEALTLAWHNTSTFKPYHAETSHMDVLSLGKSRAKTGSHNVNTVLSGLTNNHRGLYKLLLFEQYEKMVNKAEPSTMGTITYGTKFDVLYQKAIEDFVVSSEMSLKTMLKEFYDHKIAARAKTPAGDQVIFIPFSLDDIQRLVEEAL